MGSFFQSELVRGDLQEMTALQEYCFKCAMNMALLNKEQKLEYFDALAKLIEKQKLFYICLLYTSPSPRDKRQSRMPSSA